MNLNSIYEKPFLYSLGVGWSFFRHEFLFLVWALMEVALIAPVFLALSPWTFYWSPAEVTVWLLLIMLIPFNLSRVTSILGLSVQRQQIVMVAALLLIIFIAWRALVYSRDGFLALGWLSEMFGHLGVASDPRWSRELAIFAIISLMWWRGIALVGRGVDYRDIGLRMRFGVLLAVFFVAGLAASQLEWSVTPFILLFLFASLVSIVLTRVEQLELSRSGRSFPIGPSWLLFVLLVAAAVVFATGILAGLVTGKSIGSLVGWFEPIWVALRFALAAVVSIIGLLVSPLLVALIMLVNWLFSFFGPSLSEGLENLQITIQAVPTIAPDETAVNRELFSSDYRQLLTGLTMIFVVLLVALALGRLFRMARPPAELQRESISPLEGIDRPSRPGLGKRLLKHLNVFRRRQTAASIRQVYRDMCEATAERGYARGGSQTPYEYLATLGRAWPDNHYEVRLITEAYNRAHYGELPDSDEELQQIVDAWQRLSEVTETRPVQNPV